MKNKLKIGCTNLTSSYCKRFVMCKNCVYYICYIDEIIEWQLWGERTEQADYWLKHNVLMVAINVES